MGSGTGTDGADGRQAAMVERAQHANTLIVNAFIEDFFWIFSVACELPNQSISYAWVVPPPDSVAIFFCSPDDPLPVSFYNVPSSYN